MTAMILQMTWAHAGVSAGSNGFLLDGIDVFKHPWQPVPGAARAAVTDPRYGQPYAFPVYRVVVGDRALTFAAGEFSNNVWGFYVPARTTPPPMPIPGSASRVRRPMWQRVAPFAPLAAMLVEVPWTIVCVMMAMGTRENAGPPDPYWEREFYAAMIVPAVVGLLAGVIVLACRTTRGVIGYLALFVGLTACVAFVGYVGTEIFAPLQAGKPIVP